MIAFNYSIMGLFKLQLQEGRILSLIRKYYSGSRSDQVKKLKNPTDPDTIEIHNTAVIRRRTAADLVRVKVSLHGLAAVRGVSQLVDVKPVRSGRQTGYVAN
jgi:hypothetical protein